MKNYNLLIIPDIHLKHKRIQDFLNNCNYNKVIFLGDYFDDFGDNELENADTAKWLKESLNNPKHIHLIGNHDLPYLSNGKSYYCSGYSHVKNEAINRILSPKDWQKLKFFHLQSINKNKYLFSHAGLTNSRFDGGSLRDFLNKKVKQFESRPQDLRNWVAEVGFSRGGSQATGSILWCDIDEFEPIEGLSQVFGHTPTIRNGLRPLEVSKGNWAIDTHLSYIMHINKQEKEEFVNLLL